VRVGQADLKRNSVAWPLLRARPGGKARRCAASLRENCFESPPAFAMRLTHISRSMAA
jgi:hypothetical protein